ncbi:hypothetical protein BG003_008629 [Podila horticola]|nr:hypothetical protein BG003_008629 [Podila horticola]
MYFTAPHFTNDIIPDLMGKIVIVTGANGGVGYATTVALAAHGAHVFMGCRSEARAKEAMEKIRQEIKRDYPLYRGEVKLDFLELDLSDPTKVNHHFVFTLALLNRIKESQSSRIVTVSPWGHDDTGHPDGIDFTVLTNPSAVSSDPVRYCRSKLANILFTKALARRLTDERVYVNAPHPGHVSTNMAQTGRGTFAGNLFATITELFAMTPKEVL